MENQTSEQMNNQPLTKGEKKILKRQEKEEARFNAARREKIKKISAITGAAVLFIGSIAFLAVKIDWKGNNNADSGNTPKMEINPAEYDFGAISMSAGKVKKAYEIKNTGNGDLKIDNIRTSCHCTTAILKVGSKNSPEFGMDSAKSFWLEKIAPGEIGSLEVVFDPAFHGHEATGPAVRVVYISTNDPSHKEAEVKLMADVAH